MATFEADGYVLVEDGIAGSDLESLKRELEQVVAAACAEATADGGVWDSGASGADSSQCTYASTAAAPRRTRAASTRHKAWRSRRLA